MKLFLKTVFSGKETELKIASIGQAIAQAARPRTLLAPLQVGLAVQMHHHFASKFLTDSLCRHGFCSSYSEVKMFELSVTNDHFLQYVADNVDHNANTLDGYNIFHGMGIIAAITPALEDESLCQGHLQHLKMWRK